MPIQRRFLLLCLALLLLLLPATVSSQEAAAYDEGLYIRRMEGHNIAATLVEIHAVKTVDAQGARSEIHLIAEFGGTPAHQIRYSIDATFGIPEDADWLEVSGDLGWSGLDVETSLPVQVLTCQDALGGNCATTSDVVPVRIHIASFADGAVTQSGGIYQRASVFSGSVAIGTRSFGYSGAWGYNFADQYSEEPE